MQCACAILPSVDYPALQYFSHIISQRARFSGGKKLLNVKRVFRVSEQIVFEKCFIVRRTERDVIRCVLVCM